MHHLRRVPEGPFYASGGIRLFDGASGQHLGEMEGSEPIMILNRTTYANNREIVDKLLDTSLCWGGVLTKAVSAAATTRTAA